MEYLVSIFANPIRRPCRTITLPITDLAPRTLKYHVEITKVDDQITKCKVRDLTRLQAAQLQLATMMTSYGPYNVKINLQCDGNYNIVVKTDWQFHPGQVTHIVDCIKLNIPTSEVQCYYR